MAEGRGLPSDVSEINGSRIVSTLTTIGHVAKEDDSKENNSFSSKDTKDGRVRLLGQLSNLDEADDGDDNIDSPGEQEVTRNELVVASDDAGELFVAAVQSE